MCFSIVSSLAFLATISKVSAWHLTAYTNVRDCNPNEETGYQILEGNQGNCYTFGWSMPGVNCAHYTSGGADNQGCKGLFEAIAMYAHKNTNHEFFARDDCPGVGAVRAAETCVINLEMLETSGTERIRSFKCVSDFELVEWKNPTSCNIPTPNNMEMRRGL